MKTRIYYHHTDCGGVVYYANYLEFFEEARTELFEAKGILIEKLAEEGILFEVARQEIDYKYPAFYADVLETRARFMDISAVKIEIAQEIKNQNGKIVCNGKTTMACVDKNLKPTAIPEGVREKLSS